MAQVIGVHGIGKDQLGRHQILTTWRPALTDGLERAAGRPLPSPPTIDLAFYGDVFLPPARSAASPAAEGIGEVEPALRDLDEEEVAELTASAAEILTAEELAAAALADANRYSRVPLALQAVLAALDRRFGQAAGILYVGVLRQVRRYLVEPALKAEVDARVRAAADGCAALVGHSLGAVAAYEYLRRHGGPGAPLLLTVGAPLGLRMVRDRLAVGPIDGARWVNVRDRRDPVTCAGDLRQWWPQVTDAVVDNGGDAHTAERYLGKRATGEAILRALPAPPA
jgi:hypothetical protein